MKHALIIAAGDISNRQVKKYISEFSYIVCVDGGGEFFYQNHLSADFFVGDFDSISSKAYEYMVNNSSKMERYPSNKDISDMEIALDYILQKGVKKVYIFGGTGNRLDHTLANLQLMKTYSKKGLKMVIVNQNHKIYYLEGKHVIRNTHKYFSLLATSPPGAKLSIQGAKYPLEKHWLLFGSSLGISNEAVEDMIEIEVHEGSVFLFFSQD